MNRLSRYQLFMGIAELVSQRSTCYRNNVGAIIVNDDHNVVSIGYNGPRTGDRHCTGVTCERTDEGGCRRSVHAEVNAIQRCTQIIGRNFSMFCTYSPCAACAQVIAAVGLKKLYYRVPYRDDFGLRMLLKDGVTIGRVTPNGMIVDELSKELVELS